MKEPNEKCLRFVLHYYRRGKLDTRQALRTFKVRHTLSDTGMHKRLLPFCLSGAAAILLLLCAVYLYRYSDKQWIQATTQAETVNLLLPDSSSVTLYPYSSIRFRMHQEREVQMQGKIAYTVHHDSSCPFIVQGNLSKTKVLGTCFVIDESRKDTALIQVHSGKVEWIHTASGQSVILTQGMSAQVVKDKQRPEIIHRKEMKEEGSFRFDNAPLQQVLDELSRYYGVNLKTAPTSKRLTATFAKKNLDEIIRLIEKALNVKIEKTPQ